MQLRGSWSDIKDEMVLDIRALRYMPEETYKQLEIYHDSLSDVIKDTKDSVVDEWNLDKKALQYFPQEFFREVGQDTGALTNAYVGAGGASPNTTLSNIKWILIGSAALLTYVYLGPEISLLAKKFIK